MFWVLGPRCYSTIRVPRMLMSLCTICAAPQWAVRSEENYHGVRDQQTTRIKKQTPKAPTTKCQARNQMAKGENEDQETTPAEHSKANLIVVVFLLVLVAVVVIVVSHRTSTATALLLMVVVVEV